MRKHTNRETARTGVVVLAVLVAFCATTEAQVILEDNNSTIVVNDLSGLPLMDTWQVEGVDHLWELDYFYRIGSTGPETNLNTIAPHVGTVAIDSNPFTDQRPDTVSMLYSTPGVVDVELKISLLGGQVGSGWSDVTHQVKISNTGNEVMDFHLFEYTDFDLGGTFDDDTGVILSANKISQSDGIWQMSVSEVVTPDASHWDIANFPVLANSLKDADTTVLTDSVGPITGDVEYVLQWDMVLQPGESFILSKDMLIVPEPSSIALVGVISGLGVFIRRRFVG